MAHCRIVAQYVASASGPTAREDIGGRATCSSTLFDFSGVLFNTFQLLQRRTLLDVTGYTGSGDHET